MSKVKDLRNKNARSKHTTRFHNQARRSNETGQKAQDNEKEYMHVQLFGCQLARQEGTAGEKTSQPPTVERA